MIVTRRCLFGGALFAAGLAGSAPAQEFVFLTNNGGALPVSWVYAYATDIRGIGAADQVSDTSYAPEAAVMSVTANYNGFTAYASVSPDRIDAAAQTASYFGVGFCQASAYAHFTVSAAAEACVSWNFENEDPGASFQNSNLILRNETEGATILSVAGGDAGGDVVCVPLTPGVRYSFKTDAFAFEPGWATVSVTLGAGGCAADCDGNGSLNVDDVACFVDAFLGTGPAGDCDGSGSWNVDDVGCFTESFLGGC